MHAEHNTIETLLYAYDENTDSNIILARAFNFSILGRVYYITSKYPAKEDYILIANG